MFDLNTEEGRKFLKAFMEHNVMHVVFTKADGEERVMKCTLRDDIAKPPHSERPKRKENPNVLNVWDIEVNGWRSFRYDSVKMVTCPDMIK